MATKPLITPSRSTSASSKSSDSIIKKRDPSERRYPQFAVPQQESGLTPTRPFEEPQSLVQPLAVQQPSRAPLEPYLHRPTFRTPEQERLPLLQLMRSPPQQMLEPSLQPPLRQAPPASLQLPPQPPLQAQPASPQFYIPMYTDAHSGIASVHGEPLPAPQALPRETLSPVPHAYVEPGITPTTLPNLSRLLESIQTPRVESPDMMATPMLPPSGDYLQQASQQPLLSTIPTVQPAQTLEQNAHPPLQSAPKRGDDSLSCDSPSPQPAEQNLPSKTREERMQSGSPSGVPTIEVTTDNDERRSYYAWFICSLTFGSLLLPGGLLLLPLLLPDTEADTTSTPGNGSVINNDSTRNVPSECFHNVTLESSFQSLYEGNVPRKASTLPPKTVCCVYNVSRFHKAGDWDYLPKHIPFYLCTCVIYWSYGIRSGTVYSRVPAFDQLYGVSQMGRLKIANRTILLLAVGGFPEDSVHFSMLRDTRLIGRFTSQLVDTVLDNNFDGVTIHWTYPGDACGSDATDADTMVDIMTRLKALFGMNNRPDAKLSAIFPSDVDALSEGYNVSALASMLSFMFFETHMIKYKNAMYGCCRNADATFDALRKVQRRYKIPGPIVCFSASVKLWAVKLLIAKMMPYRYAGRLPSYSVSNERGRVAAFEACETANLTKEIWTQGCYKYCQGYTGTTVKDGVNTFFLTESKESYILKVDSQHCILVHDIDYDSYKSNCVGALGVDSLLTEVVGAAMDII
ncbi:uncharacterized protein LOC135369321 [Ornithodoros turicata]|uniref:uncharacterized protein LOC135369321 n=1 Tax=Ornithodoros turicata TaxID=34597 RepID=UPI0031388251